MKKNNLRLIRVFIKINAFIFLFYLGSILKEIVMKETYFIYIIVRFLAMISIYGKNVYLCKLLIVKTYEIRSDN